MTTRAWDYLCTAVINLTIICGTAYIVFWKGASGWWFVFALLLIHRPSKEASNDQTGTS